MSEWKPWAAPFPYPSLRALPDGAASVPAVELLRSRLVCGVHEYLVGRTPLPSGAGHDLGHEFLIGLYADRLMYGEPDGPDAREVMDAVCGGLASAVVLAPGGATMWGVHWCDPNGKGCLDPACPASLKGRRQ